MEKNYKSTIKAGTEVFIVKKNIYMEPIPAVVSRVDNRSIYVIEISDIGKINTKEIKFYKETMFIDGFFELDINPKDYFKRQEIKKNKKESMRKINDLLGDANPIQLKKILMMLEKR